MLVALRSQTHRDKEAFEKALLQVREVAECHLVAGEADYLLRVTCANVRDYEHVLQHVDQLPQVEHVHSLVGLRKVFGDAKCFREALEAGPLGGSASDAHMFP